MRVPVYLLPGPTLFTSEGEEGFAMFFGPFDRRSEPYIRIATGDYAKLRREWGQNDALASFIVSLRHEVIHYQQWIRSGRAWERGVTARAERMMRAYSECVRSPLRE